MITTALVLAILTTAAFMILFYKLPPRVRRFLSRRYILLDILLCWAVFSALGFALIGVMAAGFISLFVSAYLLWYKKRAEIEVPPQKRPHIPPRKYPIRWAARCHNWWRQE
jgi:hypothetical protein